MLQKSVPPVMSPFGENALEAALRIKDANESRIIVLSLGKNPQRQCSGKRLPPVPMS